MTITFVMPILLKKLQSDFKLAIMDPPENRDTHVEGLRRSWSRVGWGVVSLFVLFTCAGALYVHYTDPMPPPDIATQISSAVIAEFLFAMFLFACLALIWAVATPKWAERLWDKATWQAVLFLLLLVLTCVVYSLFGLI